MENPICPGCGREILPWMNNYCYTCQRIAQEEARYGRSGSHSRRPVEPMRRRRHFTYGSKGTGRSYLQPERLASKHHVEVPIATLQGDGLKAATLRTRLEGFNRLLYDVYGHSIRSSDILVRQGFLPEHLQRLKADSQLANRFVLRLQDELLVILGRIFPTIPRDVIVQWYDLDGQHPSHRGTLAQDLKPSSRAVERDLQRMVSYLQRSDGRNTLEMLIVRSAEAVLYK